METAADHKKIIFTYLGAIAVAAVLAVIWFLVKDYAAPEVPAPQPSHAPTRADELRAENALPRFEPLTEERKAELRAENALPRFEPLTEERKAELRQENNKF